MTTLAGTAYVDILPDLKRFSPLLRTGLRAATAKDATVTVDVDVDDALSELYLCHVRPLVVVVQIAMSPVIAP